MELYAQAYQQLAAISAVLGGLAFTAAAALLGAGVSANNPIVFGKATKLTVASALGSAVSLVIAALIWSLMAADINRAVARDKLDAVTNIIQFNWIPSWWFILGAILFFLSVGACGWIASRSLGIFSSAAGTIGSVMLIFMLRAFADI